MGKGNASRIYFRSIKQWQKKKKLFVGMSKKSKAFKNAQIVMDGPKTGTYTKVIIGVMDATIKNFINYLLNEVL